MENNDSKEWMLGFLGFLGFTAFTSHDPILLFQFCLFGLFAFFQPKIDQFKYVGYLGALFGLVMAFLGITGIIRV